MERNHSEKPFERYADDIVVHCKTEKQARYLRGQIEKRMNVCKLELHPEKTKIVNFRGITIGKYARSLDFLGFTIRVNMVETKVGKKLMPTSEIRRKSKTAILEKFRGLRIHKKRMSIEGLSAILTPIVRGLINYYCKFRSNHTRDIWYRLNVRLTK